MTDPHPNLTALRTTPEDPAEALRVLRVTIDAAYAHLSPFERAEKVALTAALLVAQGRYDSLYDLIVDTAAAGVKPGDFAGLEAFDRALRDAGLAQ